MGWFWQSTSAQPDALSSLDPQLKAYLDKSTPASSRPLPAKPSPPPEPPASTPSTAPPSAVPSASLYPDGRYAHLWATYTPPTTAAPSSQEALQNVLTSYQTLRASASRAALENCVMEHIAENECFARGTFAQKMGACRAESRRFTKCYETQTRLLRALGWMDVDLPGAEGEVRERMRMRADEVWSEIVRREDAIALAQKEGKPEPEFAPLMELRAGWVKRGREQGLNGVRVEGSREQREEKLLGVFGEEKRRELLAKLEKVPVAERELEIRLEIAEAEVHRGYGEKVGEFMELEKAERRQRKEEGKSTVGDWLKWMGGWSQ